MWGRWEVHYDPYDVSRIWVRNHHDGGWITVPWTHLRTAPVPFGEMAWEHARKIVSRESTGHPAEGEIAQVVDTLLDKAGRGLLTGQAIQGHPPRRGPHPGHEQEARENPFA